MKRLPLVPFVALLTAFFVLGSFPSVDAQDKKNKKKDVAKKVDEKKSDEKKKDEPKIEEKKKEPFVPDVPLVELKGHGDWVNGVAFAGDAVVSASRDRTVRVWDVAAKKEKHVLKGHSENVKGLVVVGNKAYATNGKWNKEKKAYEPELKVWDLAGGKEAGVVKGHAEAIESVAASADGKTLATAGEDQTAKIWDAAGKELQTLKGHTKAIHGVALSADGKKAATAGADGSLVIWDAAAGKAIHTIKAEVEVSVTDPKSKKETKTKQPGRPFTCVAFTPDGAKVVAGNLDGEVKIVETASGKELATIKAHEGVWALAISADGSKIATGGWDQTIKVWDASGKELRTIKAHLGTVTALAFSGDGQRIVSGGLDGLVKIWPTAKQ